MPSDDRRAAATARLTPEDRALVELFDRGLSAEEIAGVVGLEPSEVERRHRAAQARLTAGLEPEPRARQRPAKRRVPLVAAVLVLLIGVGVAIAVAAGGGGDEESAGGGAGEPAATDVGSTSTLETETASPEGGPVTMQRLNGTYGRGTAQLIGDAEQPMLRLDVDSFLRPVGGGYAVWLYNSGDDARRLYTTTDTSIQRDFRLPADFDRYRYVEVARAIPELDSDHSGLSLLRVRVDELTQP
jgi:hypothetical protein